jgi:serine/threonine protein kinase
MYKADIFCLGVILFALVLGRMPFEQALPNDKYYSHIYKNDYAQFWNLHAQVLNKADVEGAMIDDFKEIFQQMVSFDPAKRPTI